MTRLHLYAVLARFLTLCFLAYYGHLAVKDIARAVEDYTASYRESCILPGTIPERPEGSGWKLKWVQTHKEIKR